jgi:hypothetical protein
MRLVSGRNLLHGMNQTISDLNCRFSEHGTPTETSRSREAYGPPIKLAHTSLLLVAKSAAN